MGTSPIYVSRLAKYGIQATPYPFNKGSDYLEWRDLVVSGQLAALVRDEPALLWLADTSHLCDVAVLQQTVEPFDYGERQLLLLLLLLLLLRRSAAAAAACCCRSCCQLLLLAIRRSGCAGEAAGCM